MKVIPQQPSLLHEEVELDTAGPSMSEIRDAVSMLCLKYGAEVGLLIEGDERARMDVQAFFLAKKVSVSYRPTVKPNMFVAIINGVAR